MTAEIGILNRMGVALAADSAVTIGSTLSQKVYNSASKLFSLSKHHPVGIMIYGSAHFMGVPWEIIIKSYRKKLGNTKFDTLEEYCSSFFNYLKNDQFLVQQYAESSQVKRVFNSYLIELLNSVNDELNEKSLSEDNVKRIIKEKAESLVENISSLPIIDGFTTNFKEEFLELYQQDVLSVIENNIYIELDEGTISVLLDFAVEVFSKPLMSDSVSGIVISGYGESELFPSMFEYETEGIFSGTIKLLTKEVTKIGTESNEEYTTASVRAFAQKEMVQMFMHGIDPNLEKTLFEILGHSLINMYPVEIENALGIEFTEEQKENVKGLGNSFLNMLDQNLNSLQLEHFVYPIIETVDLLPKEELAAMAEALVNLTSFKRKVTIDAETVGGPIDVAVISKGDGFIWIRRKHYFTPDLNHHFFQNQMIGGNQNVDGDI